MTHPTSLLVHPFGAEPCELSSVGGALYLGTVGTDTSGGSSHVADTSPTAGLPTTGAKPSASAAASLRSSLAAARAEVERMRAERDEARRAGADAYAQSVKVQGWMSEETDKNGKLRSDLAALKVRVDELGVIVDKARALARHSNYHQEAPGSLERALHDALLRSFTSPSNPHPLALNERKSYAVPDQVQLLRKSPL